MKFSKSKHQKIERKQTIEEKNHFAKIPDKRKQYRKKSTLCPATMNNNSSCFILLLTQMKTEEKHNKVNILIRAICQK